jgi:hypothetical protein
MGDAVMTAVFQQQNKYLQQATQRIVQNLAYIDEIIEINMNDEEDKEMEGTGITLRHIFLQYLGKQGQPLLQSIEQTSTGGTYRFIFDKSKVTEVDAMLPSIDSDLDNIGQWEECHTHFIYLPSNPITVIGSIPHSTPLRSGLIICQLFRSAPYREKYRLQTFSDLSQNAMRG